jgi:hypothetical protein
VHFIASRAHTRREMRKSDDGNGCARRAEVENAQSAKPCMYLLKPKFISSQHITVGLPANPLKPSNGPSKIIHESNFHTDGEQNSGFISALLNDIRQHYQKPSMYQAL